MPQILGLSPAKLDSKFQEEWRFLAREADAELRAQGLLVYAGRLERVGKAEAATSIYSHLAESSQFSSIQSQAIRVVDARTGQGRFGGHFEYLLSHFAQEATSYQTILPMMLGSGIYQIGRVFALSHLAKAGFSGVGARIVAGGFGMLFETPAFVLSNRALRDGSHHPIGKELLATTLTLGALKLAGFGSEKILNWFPNPAVAFAVPKVTTFSSLLAAHQAEAQLGLRPRLDAAAAVTNTLAAMLSLGVGSHLGHRVLGPAFTSFQQSLSLRGSALRAAPDPRIPSSRSPSLATLSLMTCLAGCSASGEGSQVGGFGMAALGVGILAMAQSGRRGAKPGKTIHIRPGVLQDPVLREINKSVRSSEPTDPADPAIHGNLWVAVDRLIELGDSRGEWIGLQLKANELEAKHEDDHARYEASSQLYAPQGEFEDGINKEIQDKYGFRARYHLGETGGFKVELSGKPSELTEASFGQFLRDGYAFRLTQLTLEGRPYAKHEWLLSESNLEQMSELKSLTLNGAKKNLKKNLLPLLQSPTFRGIESLNLQHNGLEDADARSIAEASNAGNLKFLDLEKNKIGHAGVHALVTSPNLGGLKSLNLAWNNANIEGARAIGLFLNLGNLRTLNLNYNSITTVGARYIAASKNLGNLHHLDLGSNNISRLGLYALTDSDALGNLRSFDLGGNEIPSRTLKGMFSRRNFPFLKF